MLLLAANFIMSMYVLLTGLQYYISIVMTEREVPKAATDALTGAARSALNDAMGWRRGWLGRVMRDDGPATPAVPSSLGKWTDDQIVPADGSVTDDQDVNDEYIEQLSQRYARGRRSSGDSVRPWKRRAAGTILSVLTSAWRNVLYSGLTGRISMGKSRMRKYRDRGRGARRITDYRAGASSVPSEPVLPGVVSGMMKTARNAWNAAPDEGVGNRVSSTVDAAMSRGVQLVTARAAKYTMKRAGVLDPVRRTVLGEGSEGGEDLDVDRLGSAGRAQGRGVGGGESVQLVRGNARENEENVLSHGGLGAAQGVGVVPKATESSGGLGRVWDALAELGRIHKQSFGYAVLRSVPPACPFAVTMMLISSSRYRALGLVSNLLAVASLPQYARSTLMVSVHVILLFVYAVLRLMNGGAPQGMRIEQL